MLSCLQLNSVAQVLQLYAHVMHRLHTKYIISLLPNVLLLSVTVTNSTVSTATIVQTALTLRVGGLLTARTP